MEWGGEKGGRGRVLGDRRKKVNQVSSLSGWVGRDAIYRTGSDLAFLLALESLKY